MKKVFFVRFEGGRPYMLVTVKPGATTFQPLSDDADDVCDVLESVFVNKPITKNQLDAALDEDFSIEGPTVVTRETNKIIKEFMSASEAPRGKQIDISAIKIKDLGESNSQNLLNMKARAFIYEQTKTTFNYEVKRVRAIWDPSLSIPGGRRGGWRCPTGTRYGGQITDRFGRNCGWGVARRIANAITNIGERLESLDDRRRGRRVDRRNQRVERRLRRDARGGAAERGLRGIAEALDPGASTPTAPTPRAPEAPRAPKKPRGRRRVFDSDARDRGLRDSERRRVRRELDEPDAARTGEIDLDDTVELPAGESAPDSRSFRNVNNRFPKNGLPEEAYWRRDSYTGDDKAELERRFGRYYDDKNKINQRGKFVNERLDDFRKRQAAPRKKPEPRKKPRGKRKPSERPKGVVEGPLDGESFNDYADRKYDEYRKRVEQIRRDGGNAGLLTKKEWFEINQGNLREAWDKKNPEKKKPAPRKKPVPRVKPPVADKEPTPNRREDKPLTINPGEKEAKDLYPEGWFKDIADENERERLKKDFVEAFINEGQNITEVLGDGHRYGEGTPGRELLADWQADPDGEIAGRAKYIQGQIDALSKEEKKLLEQVAQLRRKDVDSLGDIGRRALARKAGRHARLMHERQRLQDILDLGVDADLRNRKGRGAEKPASKKPRRISKKDVFDNSIQAVSYDGAAQRIDELPDDWAGAGNAEELRDNLRKVAARLAKYDKDDRVELEDGNEIRVEDLAKNVLDAADAWDRFAKREREFDEDERARREEIADILENDRAVNRPGKPEDNENTVEELIRQEDEIERRLLRDGLAEFGADAKDWTEAHDGMMKQLGLLNDEVEQIDDERFRDMWEAEDAELRDLFEKEMAQLEMGNMDEAELEERINLRDEQIKAALEQLEKDLARVKELRKPKNQEEQLERRRAFGRIAAGERIVNLNRQFNRENREILNNLRGGDNARAGATPSFGSGSAPDDRSFRNVNNFFPKGLPDRPFWRDEKYDKPNKASLEKRFGRYYDEENNLTQRGKYVNDKLKKMREEGKIPPVNRRRAKRPPNSDIKRVVKFEEIDKNEGISVGDAIAHIGFRDDDNRVLDELAAHFEIGARDTDLQRIEGLPRLNMADVGEAVRERIERNKKERWNPQERANLERELANLPDELMDAKRVDAENAVKQAEDKVRTALEDLAQIRRRIKERKGSLKRLKKDDKQDLRREADRLIVWNAILLEKRARLKMIQDDYEKRVGNARGGGSDRRDFDAVLDDIKKMVPANQPNRPLPKELVDRLFDDFQKQRNREGGDRLRKLLDDGIWDDDKLKQQLEARETVLDGLQRGRNAIRQQLDDYVNRLGADERDNDFVDLVRKAVENEALIKGMESEISLIKARQNELNNRVGARYQKFVDEGVLLDFDGTDEPGMEMILDQVRKKIIDAKLNNFEDFDGGSVYLLPTGQVVFLDPTQRVALRDMERQNVITNKARKLAIIPAEKAPERPRTGGPKPEKALPTEARGPVGHAFPRRKNQMGEFGINFQEKGIGEYKPVVNREIKNLEDAINWVRDGKPLDQVPHQYWREAVSANASKSKRDKNKRFKSVAKNGGNIGDTEIYVLRDSDGFATNHGLVFKSSRAGDNIGEIVGWNYLDRLGIIEGGAVYDGPGNDGAYVMFHFAFKDIPEGNAIGKADGGDNFVYAQRKADELQGFPGRVHNWLANYILGVSDRHDGNGMMREVAHEGGKKVVVIPLDLGWAGRGVENDPLQYLRFFGMDGALMSDMATAYQRATPEGKRRILYDLERALDNIITKTENMLDVNKADFVKQAIKNVPSGEKATAEKKAEKLYDQMKKQLQNLKDSKQAIIDRVRS